MKTIQSVLKSLMQKPVKSILTLSTVGLGVCVLICATSISTAFSSLAGRQLEEHGIIITFSNGEFTEDGKLDPVRPPQFNENILDVVRYELEGARALAPLSHVSWNQLAVNGEIYNVRSPIGTTAEYLELMGLELSAGSFFTVEDVESGAARAVITESMANILFGSAEASLGKTVQPPVNQPSNNAKRGFVSPTYTIIGVYTDPADLKKKAYGVADIIVPYTSIIPAGMNTSMAKAFMLSTLAVLVQDTTYEVAEAQLREILTRQYGIDLKLEVWEGDPQGESSVLKETRSTISTFSLVVNLLGFVLLITGCIGILSIMLVDVLGRTREIALERALGASRFKVILEYLSRALIISAGSGVIGLILSLVLAGPLQKLVLPIFSGVSFSEISGGVITPITIIIGLGSVLIIGGVFGIVPVVSVLKMNITEGLREA